jgi:hypothetical protein
MKTSPPSSDALLPVQTSSADADASPSAGAPPTETELAKWVEPSSLGHPSYPEFGSELVIPPGSHPDVVRIKLRQREVLEALMAGVGMKEAARECKVHRATIYRWMKHDPDFKAALAAWQQQALTSARSRLLSAVDAAAGLLVERLDRGDMKAALAILRGNGLFAARQAHVLQADGAGEPAASQTTVAQGHSVTRRVRLRKGPALEMRLRELLLSLTDAPEPEEADDPVVTVSAAPPITAAGPLPHGQPG